MSWMLYDCDYGDLLKGPFGPHERDRIVKKLSGMNADEAVTKPELQMAVCEASMYPQIREGFRRKMSGHPPRDRRSEVGDTLP